MSQVRLQVTQIATLCKVPMRTAVPRGQHAEAVASAGHWFLLTASGVVEEEAVPAAANTCRLYNAVSACDVHSND